MLDVEKGTKRRNWEWRMSSDPSGPEKREFAFFSEHLRILISHSNVSHGQDISEQEFLSFWENPIGRESRGQGSVLEEAADNFLNCKPFLSVCSIF